MIEEDDDIGSWSSHPITKLKIKRLLELNKKNYERLISLCKVSTDPDVREACSAWETVQEVIIQLSPKQGNKG